MNKKTAKWTLTGAVAAAAFLVSGIANAETYTVEAGDTLSAIAKEKNTTVDAIAKKNKISNVNLISVGQVLEIEDANTTQKTTEQAPASKTDTTQATTTVSASDGLSAEDAAAKEWIANSTLKGAVNYTSALNSLIRFNKSEKLYTHQITSEFLQEFMAFLLNESKERAEQLKKK